MSSRPPSRGYTVRRVTVRRVTETQLSFGDAGPEATALTVAQLLSRMNGLLQGDLPMVWVRGELSGDMQPKGAWGHRYFSLKDEKANAVVKVKLFASDFRRIPFTLEEGLLVLARGCPEIYSPRGELSLKIIELIPVGAGGIALAFEQLRARLTAEGLFDASKKRALPLLPRRIGVVTSRHGAALRDILKVLGARFPNAHVTIYPASVQGAAARGEIVRAVRAFSRFPAAADVLILARGGGSKEDLATFNDEAVVRAVAASAVPVVSAVGHETDVTLTDLAADVRAATPSQAAEIVVAPLAQFESRLRDSERSLKILLKGRENGVRAELSRLLSSPAFAGFPQRVRHDRADALAAAAALLSSFRRIPSSLASRVGAASQRVAAWPSRAAFPFLVGRVAQERRAAEDRMKAQVASANEKLAVAAGRLEALSPLRVLARGYSILTKEGETAPVTDASSLRTGDTVRARFARGRASARILSTENE